MIADAKRHEGEARPLHLANFRHWPAFRPQFVAAKELSGISDQLRPVAAVPGCGRCIVLGSGIPDFACDYAVVRTDSRPEIAASILEWYVSGEEDSRAFGTRDWLESVLGVGVREVTECGGLKNF